MMGDHNNPFGYSLLTYVWVLVLGCIGGAVRYLNHMRGFRIGAFLIDMVSASFTSLITFWLCESGGISGPLQAALIGISGLMGSRAWKEFESLLRAKFGLPPASEYYKVPADQEKIYTDGEAEMSTQEDLPSSNPKPRGGLEP